MVNIDEIDELVNAVNVIKKTCSDNACCDCPLFNDERCGITDRNENPQDWEIMDIKHMRIFV